MTLLLVALGAAAGSALRLLASRALPGPRATLLVNLAGSLLLGLVAGAAPLPFALLGTGFCGGLTTFSTWSVEVLTGAGLRHALLTPAGCLLACAAGLLLAGG